MNISKLGLIISILGFISTALLKDWVATLLWLVVISQDFKIIDLEKELEERENDRL